MGVGKLRDSGVSFVALMEALEADGTTNIIATPSIVTIDNEEAEIKVAQEVPFVTGQYTNTGSTTGGTGTVNPFQTITRQEVGTILKITPQINEGGSVMLKIEQESSSIARPSSGAVDLITNKRTINTNVLVEDGGTHRARRPDPGHLTGAASSASPSSAASPARRALPTRSDQEEQDQPDGLHQADHPARRRAAAFETNEKYNYIRDQQMQRGPPANVRCCPARAGCPTAAAPPACTRAHGTEPPVRLDLRRGHARAARPPR
jgi:general secretion pathway protein D